MVTLAQRPATIALINWRVTFDWASGDGRSTIVNNQIDRMANSVKALGSTKIMLTIHHEPEPNISPGGSPSCPTQNFNGTSGSTTDYVGMWRNVRARFDALGVDNVVWVMNYMGYPTWDCVVEDLWPGNDYVDWVMWNPYPRNTSWTERIGHFYDLLTNRSDPEHDFLSKPWGLGEFGYQGTSQTTGYATYAEARANVTNGVHPRLKAYVVWDNKISSSLDNRVGYTLGGVKDPLEQTHYNALVNDPIFMGSAIPEPTDQVPPVATLTAPLEAESVAGTVPVTATVSDDTGVESVELLVDGESVASKLPSGTGEVTFDWNSLTVTNGTHTLRLRARDAAGNTGLSEGVSVTTENLDEEPPTPPSGLTGTWSKPSQVSLAWSAASDNGAVNGYRVYRDGDPMIDLGPTADGYVDEGVANLTTHTYRVSALDLAGNEGDPSAPAVVDTGDDTPPSRPDVQAILTAPDEATVSWGGSTDNAGVAGYRVYNDGTLLADVSDGSDNQVVDGLDDAATHAFSVTAYDAAGNVSAPSDPAERDDAGHDAAGGPPQPPSGLRERERDPDLERVQRQRGRRWTTSSTATACQWRRQEPRRPPTPTTRSSRTRSIATRSRRVTERATRARRATRSPA